MISMLPGNTPMVVVDGIYAKLECANPSGSIKDRMAKYVLDESEKRGVLKPGMTIVEATSGNTGIALSYYAIKKGYKIIIILQRKRCLKSSKPLLRSSRTDFQSISRMG